MPRAPSGKGRRGRQESLDEQLGDGRGWPMFRAQQRMLAELPEGEAEAAARRAQVLVEQGYGALQDWLEKPGEQAARQARPSGRDRIADLFDAA